MLVCGLIYLKTGLFKMFYHDGLDWHVPINDSKHYRGINHCAICKHCGKRIMQDSQGNWFSIDI